MKTRPEFIKLPTSRTEAFDLLKEIRALSLTWHFDDDPAEVIGSDGGALFSAVEAHFARALVEQLNELFADCPNPDAINAGAWYAGQLVDWGDMASREDWPTARHCSLGVVARAVIDLLPPSWGATYEHPGYIRVELPDSRNIAVGTVNARWDYHLTEVDGNPIETPDVPTLPLSARPHEIAAYIIRAYELHARH